MIFIENSALPFPDVYSNDLRKHMLSHPVPPQKDPLVIAQQQQLLNRNNCNLDFKIIKFFSQWILFNKF